MKKVLESVFIHNLKSWQIIWFFGSSGEELQHILDRFVKVYTETAWGNWGSTKNKIVVNTEIFYLNIFFIFILILLSLITH